MSEKNKIVVVEDDHVLNKTLSEYLINEGYQIKSALDGEEGLKLILQEKPDLILLDIILPKKDGYEILKSIKVDDSTKKIPVVLLTNLGSLSDVEKALNLGATTYMVKADYKLEEILAKIKELLR